MNWPFVMSNFVIYVPIFCAIYLVAWRMGHIGFSFGAWWALSAYCSGFVLSETSSLLLAMIAALVGAIIGSLLHWLLSLRLRKLSYTLGSLAIQEFILAFIASFAPFGGRLGLYGWDRFALDQHTFLILSIVLVCQIGFILILNTRFARKLDAVKTDQLAAESTGIRPGKLWLGCYILAGLFIGVSGFLYAAHYGSVMYNSFEMHQSILLLLAVVVGQCFGSLAPLAGVGMLVILPELFRFLYLPIQSPDYLRNMFFASAAFVILLLQASVRPLKILKG